MNKCLLLSGFIFLLSGSGIAQGDIKVIKDSRINALVAKQCQITPPDINPKIDGFRVQLFFDSEKTAVNDARSRFISKFPRVDTYVEFNSPYYYLKVGDFRTRLEAERIKAAMEAEFPTSFIVEEEVNLPRLRKEEVK